MLQQSTQFLVNNTAVNGFFHLPDASRQGLPIVIMFNGYGTEWSFGTQPFIEAFTALGFATLNFDYRYFGGSAGEPRQMVDIPAQLEDCRSAIQHVLDQSWVDKKRIVIWGSSLGGGHAISMAAEFQDVYALIAQVPHCCSRAAMKTVRLSAIVKGMTLAILDSIGAKFGLGVRSIPIVASPAEYGVMNHLLWKEHYLALAKNSKTWVNAIPARSLLRGGDYRPILQAASVKCRSLIVAANQDSGVPITAVKETVATMPNADLFTFDGEHFDVYHGEFFDEILAREIVFLKDSIHFSL